MSRIVFIILSIVLPLGIVLLYYGVPSEENPLPISIIIIYLIFVQILTIFRLRYLKLSWKDCFKAIIPFYGAKYRYLIFTEK